MGIGRQPDSAHKETKDAERLELLCVCWLINLFVIQSDRIEQEALNVKDKDLQQCLLTRFACCLDSQITFKKQKDVS